MLVPIEATYGRGLVDGVGAELAARHGPPVVITRPTPWSLVRDRLGTQPLAVAEVRGLERARLEELERSLPHGPILGIGGGSAIDAAKWLGWRRSAPLWLVPSLPSVDAVFMRSVAVRELGGVVYEGAAEPELVVVDFELMRQAPAHLARAGLGDVISCHTAVWDWQYASERGHDPAWDEEAAAVGRAMVQRMASAAPAIRAREDDGIERLMEAFREVGQVIDRIGHARFEEGSEHFLAYALEQATGRTFMHGELVSLGTLVMAVFQQHEPTFVRDILATAEVRFQPERLGIGWDVLEGTLRELPAYVREHDLWYSIADVLDVSEVRVRELRAILGEHGT